MTRSDAELRRSLPSLTKPMSDIITCPSGLTGRIRSMKVREERVLADRKLAKGGGQVEALGSSDGGSEGGSAGVVARQNLGVGEPSTFNDQPELQELRPGFHVRLERASATHYQRSED